jgi:hypothetical protein
MVLQTILLAGQLRVEQQQGENQLSPLLFVDERVQRGEGAALAGEAKSL